MAQNIIQIQNNTIWFDDTLYKVNTYGEDSGRIDVVKLSNSTVTLSIYNNVVHWKVATGLTPVAYLGGIRINLP